MLQQMQPLAREIHSSVEVPDWETVRDFSMSAVLPNSVIKKLEGVGKGGSGGMCTSRLGGRRCVSRVGR
jgi:hypothetical protein